MSQHFWRELSNGARHMPDHMSVCMPMDMSAGTSTHVCTYFHVLGAARMQLPRTSAIPHGDAAPQARHLSHSDVRAAVRASLHTCPCTHVYTHAYTHTSMPHAGLRFCTCVYTCTFFTHKLAAFECNTAMTHEWATVLDNDNRTYDHRHHISKHMSMHLSSILVHAHVCAATPIMGRCRWERSRRS